MPSCQNCEENLDDEAENWDLDKECVIHQYPDEWGEVKSYYCDPECFIEAHT